MATAETRPALAGQMKGERMKDDIVNGQRVRCYDNAGRTLDRYTAVYMDYPERNACRKARTFEAVAMNGRPFHPQGFGQHCIAAVGRHLGKRIALEDLPPDCQKLVRSDMA